MAASAATLRLLLRCRASARGPPSLALLHPLIPGPFSTPFSPPLPGAASASAGLLDVRRALVSPAPAPYLLRHYSSKPSKGSAPWRPTGDKGTPSQKQVKQNCSIVTYLETWLHRRRVLNRYKDLLKLSEMMNEALETFDKAHNLLFDEWWDDRAVAMFENELDNTREALAVYEKGVDDLAKAVERSKGLPVHILQEYQALFKQMKDTNKCSRQSLEKISSRFENVKMLRKLNMALLPSPFEILKKLIMTTVGLGTCLTLTLVKQHCSIVTYLEIWLHTRRVLNRQNDLLKQSEMMMEAWETFQKASNLLFHKWWDDRVFAMYENELDNTREALAAYEKGVDDFAKAVDNSKGLPVHILKKYQALCKKMKGGNKCLRQNLEKISSNIEILKILRKLITITAAGLGACLVLTLVFVCYLN